MAKAEYVLESALNPFAPGQPLYQGPFGDSATDRAQALGCAEVVVGDPTGTVTAFPSVLVLSTSVPPVATPSVISDDAAQATLAEVSAALQPVQAAEAQLADSVTTAKATMSGLAPQLGVYQAQIAADLASVASWSTLTASEQAAIMGRVIQGFGTLMEALYSHALLTRSIP